MSGVRFSEEWYAQRLAQAVVAPIKRTKTSAKPSKYRAIKTKVDGITFDSKREAARYVELMTMHKAGEITEPVLQLKFPLVVNEELICSYRADFVYERAGVVVVEDVKGVRTAVYRIKKKLMAALLHIEIHEV